MGFVVNIIAYQNSKKTYHNVHGMHGDKTLFVHDNDYSIILRNNTV